MWRPLDAPARRRFTDLAHLPSERAGEVALPRPGHAAGIIAIAPAGSVAGVARYERMAGDAAGFLVFVDASWRRAGLGTVLLRRLAEAARHAGVRRMAGDLPEGDVAMRGLLAELGLEYTEQVTAATVHASFAVRETDAYLDAVLADQRAAARVAVGPFLRPGSIALVGAGNTVDLTPNDLFLCWDEAAAALGRIARWAEWRGELDLNPVFVRQHGTVVADVRVRLAG